MAYAILWLFAFVFVVWLIYKPISKWIFRASREERARLDAIANGDESAWPKKKGFFRVNGVVKEYMVLGIRTYLAVEDENGKEHVWNIKNLTPTQESGVVDKSEEHEDMKSKKGK